ncbi:hypothetical protein G6F43_007438 [Rhizopus delemar]|nr:hypothetical protein G6F43_007438 [Rhizopus delemar]
MFYAFRFDDNNLSSFTRAQKRQVQVVQDFIMEKPGGFCCVCLKVLYLEDQCFRAIDNDANLPCLQWKMQPLCNSGDETMKMVCKTHVNTAEDEFPSLSMMYPGDLAPETKDLDYRERSVLSPIKLISQITRKSTLVHGGIGHYEVKGPMYTTHNYEFAEMAALQRTHPLLARYDIPKLTFSLVNYHVSENKKHVNIDKGWLNNTLFANEDVNPQATDVEFKDLIIGEDNVGKMASCTGHYTMVPQNVEEFSERNETYSLPEYQEGVAQATMDMKSLPGYVKKGYLYKTEDLQEILSTKVRNNLTQGDAVNPVTGKMNKNIVSTVPSQIRSSYAYKRKNFLDLQCIFENLGAPQLFLTVTCDDKS